MLNQLNLSSSPFYVNGNRSLKTQSFMHNLDDPPHFVRQPKEPFRESIEEYYGYPTQVTNSNNSKFGNLPGNMRTRSSSESTTMSTGGITSPRSGSHMLPDQAIEWPYSDEPQSQVVPSTPFIHKYKTELCKNWEIEGKCQFGETCSFAHGLSQLHSKIDLPSKYKTKLCKRFQEELYCPYGIRCQFIHNVRMQPAEQQPEFLKKPEEIPYSQILSYNLRTTLETHILLRKCYGKQSMIHYINSFKTKRLRCFQMVTSTPSAFSIDESAEEEQSESNNTLMISLQHMNSSYKYQGLVNSLSAISQEHQYITFMNPLLCQ